MKKYFSFALIIWFVSVALSIAAAPDKDAIMAKEKEAWQAFKDKNADGFKKVVAADFRGVYAQGVVDMKAELDDMQKSDMKSFTISGGADTAETSWTNPLNLMRVIPPKGAR